MRKYRQLSVHDVLEKSGIPRQTFYDVIHGKNFSIEKYETLLRACGYTAEEWYAGMTEPALPGMPRRHQDLFHLLAAIVKHGDDGMIESVRTVLDGLSDKALDKRSRGSPHPESREGGGHGGEMPPRKKTKQAG